MNGGRIDMTHIEDKHTLNPEVECLRKEIFNIWKKENKEIFESFSYEEMRSLDGFLHNAYFEAYRPSFMRYIKRWVDAILEARKDATP